MNTVKNSSSVVLLQRGSDGEIVRDHPEANHAVAALHEDAFRLLLEAIQDHAIFMLDTEGYVISWNAGAERLKGYSAPEIIGRHFSRFYPEEDRRSGKPGELLKLAAARAVFSHMSRCFHRGARERTPGARGLLFDDAFVGSGSCLTDGLSGSTAANYDWCRTLHLRRGLVIAG
jgi:PAS domain-containing protein